MNNITDPVPFLGLDHNMNVIRHHAPCQYMVAFSVKMQQRILDEMGDVYAGQPAAPVPFVLKSRNPLPKFDCNRIFRR